MRDKSEILVCYHCGNRAPHCRLAVHQGQELFDYDGKIRYKEEFLYYVYKCKTCEGISIYGDFSQYGEPERSLDEMRLYPEGSKLEPKSHTVSPSPCIPIHVREIYEEIWPLRHLAPNAFAGQVRRLLEFVCKDCEASGGKLFHQIQDLIKKGIFPAHISKIADKLRNMGNVGSHAAESEIGYGKAELIDYFFRSVIEYVYIIPAQLKRLSEREKFDSTPDG